MRLWELGKGYLNWRCSVISVGDDFFIAEIIYGTRIMNRRVLLALLLIFALASPAIASAQPQVQCNSIQDTEICINDISLSESTVTNGDSIRVNIELTNYGNNTGDAVILMGTHQPEGGHTYSLLKEVDNLEPREDKPLSLTLPVENNGPAGVHEMNFMVFDTSQEHLYDATGYSTTLIINEDSINIVRWLKGAHYTIQIGIVVVPIIVAVVGRWMFNN